MIAWAKEKGRQIAEPVRVYWNANGEWWMDNVIEGCLFIVSIVVITGLMAWNALLTVLSSLRGFPPRAWTALLSILSNLQGFSLPSNCCCRYGIILCLALAGSSFLTSSPKIGDRGFELLPLAKFIPNTQCFAVPPTALNQSYNGRPFLDYIKSMQVWIARQGMVGTTAFHVGLPLCAITFIDDDNTTIRTLLNPDIVGWVTEETTMVRETDVVLCPDAPAVFRRRHKRITVEFSDVMDLARFSGKIPPKAAAGAASAEDHRKNTHEEVKLPRTKERFGVGSSLIIQFLVDVLSQRSICNDAIK